MPLPTSTVLNSYTQQITIEFKAGGTVVFIGANGSGKTRLGVLLDLNLSQAGVDVHRIAAHRSLTLNPNVVPPSLEVATNRLYYGYDNGSSSDKSGHRFGGKPETAMLSDFDHVLTALYAENNDVSIKYRQEAMASPTALRAPSSAKIDKLKQIWEKVLPHRKLIVTGGNLKVQEAESNPYSASDMSDGERVIFYLIGQALLAKPDTILIFDEPELHINRSILAKVWDEIESARCDCCFVYITHDIDFASSRRAATKYAVRAYRTLPTIAWDLEFVPEDTELPDDVVAIIVGSRRPILFVEGDGGSLDSSLYRRVYSDFTVIPVGSCDHVIHTVGSFAARPQLHRVGCAGLVDADGRTDEVAAYLADRSIYRLPVSEVENLLLLPRVFLAIAKDLKFTDTDAFAKLSELQFVIYAQANEQIDSICLRHTKRRVDADMKKLGIVGDSIVSLEYSFKQAAASVDPVAIFNHLKTNLDAAIKNKDYEKVLLDFDNKGLLADAAKLLGLQKKNLEEYVGRTLRSKDGAALQAALTSYLPTVVPRP